VWARGGSLLKLHDESKDKPMELEMGWITEATGWTYKPVPKAVV
jgi:hypothetical protein